MLNNRRDWLLSSLFGRRHVGRAPVDGLPVWFSVHPRRASRNSLHARSPTAQKDAAVDRQHLHQRRSINCNCPRPTYEGTAIHSPDPSRIGATPVALGESPMERRSPGLARCGRRASRIRWSADQSSAIDRSDGAGDQPHGDEADCGLTNQNRWWSRRTLKRRAPARHGPARTESRWADATRASW